MTTYTESELKAIIAECVAKEFAALKYRLECLEIEADNFRWCEDCKEYVKMGYATHETEPTTWEQHLLDAKEFRQQNPHEKEN